MKCAVRDCDRNLCCVFGCVGSVWLGLVGLDWSVEFSPTHSLTLSTHSSSWQRKVKESSKNKTAHKSTQTQQQKEQ